MSKNQQRNGVDEGVEVVQTSALMEITRGEVDMQVATAKRYPRSVAAFKREVFEMATIDKETAAECTYAIPRGNKMITGPSIRFAEILASAFGNIREEKRSLEPEAKVVRGQATVWDMERNRCVRVEISRRITGSNGRRYGDDMISTTSNAAASIAHRNAILSCIPKAHWVQIHDKVQEAAAGDATTLGDDRAGAMAWFDRAGISAERVFAVMRVEGVEDIGLKKLATLKQIIVASREGSLKLREAFPDTKAQEAAKSEPPPDGTHKVGRKKAKEEPEPKTEEEDEIPALVDVVFARIAAADDLADLEKAGPNPSEAARLVESSDYDLVAEKLDEREGVLEQEAETEATRG